MTPTRSGTSPDPGAARPSPAAPGALPGLRFAAPGLGLAVPQGVAGRVGVSVKARSLAAFVAAAGVYWGSVFPMVCVELRRRRLDVERIPDERRRTVALAALEKRSNMEGAAAFATFVPAEHRAAVLRATVAFQSLYNHLDMLGEQPQRDAIATSRVLHSALVEALRPHGEDDLPGLAELAGDDGGHLLPMVEETRRAVRELPCYRVVEVAALRAARRVATFQTFNCGELQGDHASLSRWAQGETSRDAGLLWWETAGSGGSSLGVHVMLAAAASPEVFKAATDAEAAEIVEAIESAYFPWIGALHSMLDQVIDIEEDDRTGQANLARYYGSTAEAAERMRLLARRSIEQAETLSRRGHGVKHELIVIAMSCLYLSASREDEVSHAVRSAVLGELGPLSRPAIAIFRLARRAGGTQTKVHEQLLQGAVAVSPLPAGHRTCESPPRRSARELDSGVGVL